MRDRDLADAAMGPDRTLLGMSLPGATRLAGVLFWVVFPVLSAVSILLGTRSLAAHLGERYDTPPGTFTVTTKSCHDQLCTVSGDFDGADPIYSRYQIAGDPRWKIGDTRPAFLDVGSSEVRAHQEYWNPSTSLFAVTGGGVYLIVVGWIGLGSIANRAVPPAELTAAARQ